MKPLIECTYIVNEDSAVKVTSWTQPLLPRGETTRTTPSPLRLTDNDIQQTSTYSAGPLLNQGIITPSKINNID